MSPSGPGMPRFETGGDSKITSWMAKRRVRTGGMVEKIVSCVEGSTDAGNSAGSVLAGSDDGASSAESLVMRNVEMPLVRAEAALLSSGWRCSQRACDGCMILGY